MTVDPEDVHIPRRPDAESGTGLRSLTCQGVNQLAQVQGISGGLSGQLAQRILGRGAEHGRHQGGHVRFGQWPERDHCPVAAGEGRGNDVRRGHQAVGGLVVLVHADAVEPELVG